MQMLQSGFKEMSIGKLPILTILNGDENLDNHQPGIYIQKSFKFEKSRLHNKKGLFL